MKKSVLLEQVRTVNYKCPMCGSKNLTITDSFTVFGPSSKIMGNELRMTPYGDVINVAFRKNTSGNKSMLLCKDCGFEWEAKEIDDSIEVIKR